MKRIDLLILCAISISCSQFNEQETDTGKVLPGKDAAWTNNPPIICRESKYLNLEVKTIDHANGIIKDIDSGKPVRATSFVIDAQVSSFTPSMFDSLKFDVWNDYVIPGDDLIYIQLNRQHFTTPVGYAIEYRLEELQRVVISSSIGLFNRPAGSDISDKFVLYGNESGILPWITNDKKYRGLISKNTEISSFIDSKPLVFADAFLLMQESPPESITGIDCFFTVEIILKNVTLTQSTQEINLH